MNVAVPPRFNKAWYKHHGASCFDKGAAFGVGAALNLLPFAVLWHGRRWFSGNSVAVKEMLMRTAQDTGWTSLSAGVFVGTYCALNNAMGYASIGTASVSGAIAGSCFAVGKLQWLPYSVAGGAALAIVAWLTTPVLQSMAEERQPTTEKD